MASIGAVVLLAAGMAACGKKTGRNRDIFLKKIRRNRGICKKRLIIIQKFMKGEGLYEEKQKYS